MALLLGMKRPPSSEKEAAGMLESIWPCIQLAYQICSAQVASRKHYDDIYQLAEADGAGGETAWKYFQIV